MSEDLKPCPFCGSHAEMDECAGNKFSNFWWVHCSKCDTDFTSGYFSNRGLEPDVKEEELRQLTKFWNRRV